MLEEVLQPRGLVLDRPADEVPKEFWTAGNNMFFRDGASQRVGGYETYYRNNQNPGWQPVFIYPVQNRSFVEWLIVIRSRSQGTWDTGRMIRFDGQNEVILHTYNFDVWQTEWMATDHNGTIIVNSTAEGPRYWNRITDTMDELPGWPVGQICRSIRSFKNHLFAFNLSNAITDPNGYLFSDASAPGQIPERWDPAPDTDAGSGQIPNPMGAVVDAVNLRSGLLVCKDYSSHLIQYTGGTFVFAQRDLHIDVGMINPRCGLEINSRAIIMTQDDIVETDGAGMRSIAADKVRRHIFNSLADDRIEYCQLVKRHLYDEIWVCYPTDLVDQFVYATQAAIYNTRTESWGIRDLPNIRCLEYGLVNKPDAKITWDSRDNAWDEDSTQWDEKFFSNTADSILMAAPEQRPDGDDDSVGAVYIHDLSFEFSNYAPYIPEINAEIRREGVHLGDDPSQVTFVNEVWPHIVGTPGDVVRCQVGGQFSEDEPIRWSREAVYTIGESRWLSVAVSGRLISFRFWSTTANTWRIYNFRVRFRFKGRF